MNFGNILLGSPQLNVALVGQTNTQGAANLAGVSLLGQAVLQGAGNGSVIGQGNYVLD